MERRGGGWEGEEGRGMGRRGGGGREGEERPEEREEGESSI